MRPNSTPFDGLVQAYLNLPQTAAGVQQPLVPPAALHNVAPAPNAPVCLVCSPHPDDESLCGAAPLRLRSEHGWRVVNLAITLGSKVERQAARWQEAQAACDYLGFELRSASGRPGVALERIGPDTAAREPAHWAQVVAQVAQVIKELRPAVIVAPHALDGHAAHIGTHQLVCAALAQQPRDWACQLLWSEYWNTQMFPRLMLEVSATQVAQLMTATALHTGEVARHPYHLVLPSWFIDGARRGTERVGAPGSAATPMRMAALYGWQRHVNGVLCDVGPAQVGATDDLAACLGQAVSI